MSPCVFCSDDALWSSGKFEFSHDAGKHFSPAFRSGGVLLGLSVFSVLKPAEKTQFVRQLAASGAGRGRVGTGSRGNPANITFDTRYFKLSDGSPSGDFKLLMEAAEAAEAADGQPDSAPRD